MRLQTRILLLLLGIGAVVLGGQWYLAATQNPTLTDPDAFIASMKSVALASVVLAGGMWVAIKASGLGQSA